MADIQIPSAAGFLQVRPLWQAGSDKVVILCHPHPLFGGTMDNKVVTTMARFFRNQGISVLTFNFRGVGASTGQHDHGVGEIEDFFSVLTWVVAERGLSQLYIAGFSFGAYIAAAAASRINQQQVPAELAGVNLLKTFLVAPAVHHNPMQDLQLKPDTLVVIGRDDEIVSPEDVIQWSKALSLDIKIVENCGHFFHGHLPELSSYLQDSFLQNGFP